VKSILVVGAVLALWIPAAAPGQSLLRSDPPGARLRLEGPLAVGGAAPLHLDEIPAGRYRLLAGGGATSVARGWLRWDGERSLHLDGYAGAGAVLMPPGLGHLSRDEGRGTAFLLTGLGGAAGAVVSQIQYGRADDRTASSRQDYLDAVSESEVVNARIAYQVDARWKSDKEEMRALWLGYAAYAWLGAGIELWLLTPRASLSPAGSGYALGVPSANGAAAGLRSLLVPGAGQRALGHDARGTRFLLATAVAGAGALVVHDVYLDQKRDQYEAQLRYDAARTEAEAEVWRARLEDEANDVDVWDTVQWCAFGVTGAIWLWNVVDAVTLPGKAASSSNFGWRLTPSPGGMTAALAWRIG